MIAFIQSIENFNRERQPIERLRENCEFPGLTPSQITMADISFNFDVSDIMMSDENHVYVEIDDAEMLSIMEKLDTEIENNTKEEPCANKISRNVSPSCVALCIGSHLYTQH